VDVGGQTPERKKWQAIIQEGFTSVLYIAALDEYNMESSEEPGKTKMEVALSVFENIINDTKNYQCCNILFLNKSDLFKEKILSKRGLLEFNEKYPNFQNYLKNDFDNEIKDMKIYIESKRDRTYWAP